MLETKVMLVKLNLISIGTYNYHQTVVTTFYNNMVWKNANLFSCKHTFTLEYGPFLTIDNTNK